ncbi:IS200/IS605 family transposase [Natribacillus halophilus]|uniref:Putative transposase n=1 Tax=Natribacillus halophilus TaxID=549003 RepID=A0A1G8SM65_9BACI|nr:IS200/IS605 family transposase [Natribacillus halophilus]SDJ30253.1 putative transposase [Natribacillus halophilus]
MGAKSLSHTRWDCSYHIIFIPKYRRKIFFKKIRKDVGEVLRSLCEYKNVELVKESISADHVHMYVKIPPKISVSQFMGYLKGKSALMVFDRFPELRRYGNGRHLWAKGYYVSTVGLNKDVIREYIQQQEEADMIEDRIDRDKK